MNERDENFERYRERSGGSYGGGSFGRGGFQGGGGSGRVLDDFARLMTDVAGVAQGARREVETAMRAQAERFVSGMDLVSREEFEAVKEMAVRARTENESLKARLDALEAAKPAAKSTGKPKKATKPAG